MRFIILALFILYTLQASAGLFDLRIEKMDAVIDKMAYTGEIRLTKYYSGSNSFRVISPYIKSDGTTSDRTLMKVEFKKNTDEISSLYNWSASEFHNLKRHTSEVHTSEIAQFYLNALLPNKDFNDFTFTANRKGRIIDITLLEKKNGHLVFPGITMWTNQHGVLISFHNQLKEHLTITSSGEIGIEKEKAISIATRQLNLNIWSYTAFQDGTQEISQYKLSTSPIYDQPFLVHTGNFNFDCGRRKHHKNWKQPLGDYSGMRHAWVIQFIATGRSCEGYGYIYVDTLTGDIIGGFVNLNAYTIMQRIGYYVDSKSPVLYEFVNICEDQFMGVFTGIKRALGL